MTGAIGRVMAAAAIGATLAAGAVRPRTVALADLPDRHGLAGAFAGTHAGWLLVAGGANFPDRMPWKGGTKVWHDRVFGLGPEDGSGWREIGRLPAANAYGVSLTVREGVLVIGGGNAERNFADVRLMTLDGASPAFTRLPSLPVPLAQMAGAVVGRAVHVAGGTARPDATAATSRHFRLDLDSVDDGWQEMPPLPGPGRMLAIAAGHGDGFYVAGGCSLAPGPDGKPTRTYLREAWRFAGGRWTRLADLPGPLAASASPAPIFGDNVYVVSGDDGAQVGVPPAQHKGFSSRILRYDTTRNTWHDAGHVDGQPPVTLPTAPWKDGYALVSGEIRPGVRTRQVLHFLPDNDRVR